jgi:hypothetical protein
MSEHPDDLVGHGTTAAGEHTSITRAEADALFAEIEAEKSARAELMPDSAAARRMLFNAQQRLKELGWHIVEWGGSYEASYDDGGGYMPCLQRASLSD